MTEKGLTLQLRLFYFCLAALVVSFVIEAMPHTASAEAFYVWADTFRLISINPSPSLMMLLMDVAASLAYLVGLLVAISTIGTDPVGGRRWLLYAVFGYSFVLTLGLPVALTTTAFRDPNTELLFALALPLQFAVVCVGMAYRYRSVLKFRNVKTPDDKRHPGVD